MGIILTPEAQMALTVLASEFRQHYPDAKYLRLRFDGYSLTPCDEPDDPANIRALRLELSRAKMREMALQAENKALIVPEDAAALLRWVADKIQRGDASVPDADEYQDDDAYLTPG